MDTESIKQLAMDINNVSMASADATAKKYQRQIDALLEDNKELARKLHIAKETVVKLAKLGGATKKTIKEFEELIG